ncbi:TetR family transcriptional regulator [Mobilisporobacter senegalensis]|uniref:TetR family transcriptional regulator n=1 Tax=Mobilisporobacter senegalensis TaxID=1329262 RepID=A0A3N1XB50_9FIRM|nr:TetR/AcrR family transcriptional regulator C-terminal domain-containing protein [Mobilisporobacter senegalensis]ROR23945.1 TetR family transcriptional regulator [Mobilisporobacter senegalensis]
MSDSNITKLAFANSFKNLMIRKEFNKICVSEISADCSLTRQAFYYHFKDKYELMNWIYYTESASFMKYFYNIEYWTEGLEAFSDYMRQNKILYINALNTTGQNSFQEYLYNYICDILTAVIIKLEDTEYEKENWEFAIEFIATAFISLIVRWANKGMKEEFIEYFPKIISLFDGSIFEKIEMRSKRGFFEEQKNPVDR